MTTPDGVSAVSQPLSIDALIREAHPIANRIARTVVRHFSEYIERDDLTQELMLWTLEHADKVREYLTPTDDDPECKVGRRKLHTAYRRFARGVANKAKAARLGYDIGDLHFYSNAQVEELLPLALDYDAWLPGRTAEDVSRSGKSPSIRGDLTALLTDVKVAYEAASQVDRDLLFERFVASPPSDTLTLAYVAGISRQAMNARINRALGRMVDRLGGFRPDWGEAA